MFAVIWQYTVSPEHLHSFIEYYDSQGVWVKFFQQSLYYFETELVQLNDHEFITIDKWASEQTYRQFLDTEKYAYNTIDKCCKNFTFNENCVGSFYQLEL